MYSAHFSTIYVPGMSYMQKEKLLFPHSVATDFTFSTKKLSSFFLFFRWYCLNYEKSFCGNEEKKLLNVLFPLLHFFLPLLSFSKVTSIRQYSNSFIYFFAVFFISLYTSTSTQYNIHKFYSYYIFCYSIVVDCHNRSCWSKSGMWWRNYDEKIFKKILSKSLTF